MLVCYECPNAHALKNDAKSRIESITDPAKRAAAVEKIAVRLDNIPYWVDYAKKL